MRIHEITEAFNAVQPFNWHYWSDDTAQETVADFQIGNGHFKVLFKEKYYQPGYWELSFVRNGSLDLTGTGNAASVLATVMQIVREFIAAQDPRWINYAAKNDEGSRNKLYPKLMTMMQREFSQYVAKEPKKLRTHTSYELERPAKEYVPPPAPTPTVEPVDDLSMEELDKFMDEFAAEYRARRTR